jgi:hypothetical protein
MAQLIFPWRELCPFRPTRYYPVIVGLIFRCGTRVVFYI